MKRIVLGITKALAAIAAIVFWFMPLHTTTQVLAFAASIVVLLICFAVSSNLDEEKTGYWPDQT